jgi:hypothetical protein
MASVTMIITDNRDEEHAELSFEATTGSLWQRGARRSFNGQQRDLPVPWRSEDLQLCHGSRPCAHWRAVPRGARTEQPEPTMARPLAPQQDRPQADPPRHVQEEADDDDDDAVRLSESSFV